MTNHFTQEEAVALAAPFGIDQTGLFGSGDIQSLCNAAVTAKLKEWEAQGAVAYVDGDDASRRVLWEPEQAAFDLPVGTKLYTHPLPAQEVNAELAEPVNPCPIGSPRSAWLAGYNGTTNFGAKGSDNDRQWKEGAAARKQYLAALANAKAAQLKEQK